MDAPARGQDAPMRAKSAGGGNIMHVDRPAYKDKYWLFKINIGCQNVYFLWLLLVVVRYGVGVPIVASGTSSVARVID